MPPRRRAAGEGSYYKSSDGGWRGAVSLRQPDGSTVRRYVRGRTRREVMDRAAALRTRHEAARTASAAPPPPPTLADAVAAWRAEVRGALKTNTAAAIDSALRQLPDDLLTTPLTGLAAALRAYYQQMRDAGYAPGTVRQHHSSVRAVLRHAQATGSLEVLPAGIVLPLAPRSAPVTLTATEARRLLATARAGGDDLHVVWALLLCTGMRLGEALGLCWTDIDLDGDSPRLTVTRQLLNRGARLLAEPKTPASRRNLPIVEPLASVLRTERAAERPAHPWGLVAATVDGRAWRQERVRIRFDQALARAGLPRVTPHGLRHTAATLLLEAGVNPRVVADLLGHSSVTMTLTVYSHVTERLARTGAEELGKALLGAGAAGDAAGEPGEGDI